MDDIKVYDDVFKEDFFRSIVGYISSSEWKFGAYSGKGQYPYWFKHYAGVFGGSIKAEDLEDCSNQLENPLKTAWGMFQKNILKGHILTRCYANAYPYGTEGMVHTDANVDTHYTVIYYPHLQWNINWAGETMFFDEKDEVVATVTPKPNRAVIFKGMISHVGRGITRVCPVVRTTLMFKTASGKE